MNETLADASVFFVCQHEKDYNIDIDIIRNLFYTY